MPQFMMVCRGRVLRHVGHDRGKGSAAMVKWGAWTGNVVAALAFADGHPSSSAGLGNYATDVLDLMPVPFHDRRAGIPGKTVAAS